MGYYTSYSMDVTGFDETTLTKLIAMMREKDLLGYVFDAEYLLDKNGTTISFSPYDTQKWYLHDEDMLDISRKFPDMTFKLVGTGEDPDDRWYTLYHNGECETIHSVITWPDPKKIQWKEGKW